MNGPEAAGEGALPRASRWVLVAGAALVLGGVTVIGGLLWRERAELLSAQRVRAELMARVLEDHATRNIESVSLAVATLTETFSRGGPRETEQVEAAFAQAQASLPLLRGLAVLDNEGRVLHATEAGLRGRQVPLERLGPRPLPQRDTLGPWVAGRRLGDLVGQGAVTPPGVGYLPLWRTGALPDGRAFHVVALLNPDAFASFQEVMLNDPDAAAAMVSYDGRLIASTQSSDRRVGESLTSLPPFTRFLPAVESASWEGPGLRQTAQVGAFRVLRVRPLMVMVEFDRDAVMRQWLQQMLGVIGVSATAVLAVLAMTLAVAASLRQREAARAERDAAQAQVAQRERELTSIFRSVQELLLRTDAQGVVTFINERWLTLTGQPPTMAVGRPLADLVAPESATAVQRLFRREGDAVRQALVRLLGPGGRAVWLDLAVVPLSDEATGGFAASAVDVTGVQAAQAALKSQLVFTDSLLETNPLPVSVLDVAGRYLRVNRAWEDFFGRQRDAVMGTRAAAALPPDEAARHDAQDQELISGRSARLRYEATHARADGRTHDLLVSKSLLRDASGAPEALVCTFLDISEFREAERATREARDAAEEASRVKSEFIANISHELRTPLQSILGFSELGMGRGRDHPKLAGMFEDIHRSGQRMLSLVNDLLDVAKIESTVGGMVLERADVRVLLREVVAELVPLCASKALRIAPEMPAAALIARVDPMRLQQVVRNVLANAIRFSPEGGTIDLVATATAGGGTEIRVSDRGPGIPPDETERIFEAFVQSSKTKDGSGGTGLGLAICRRIMDAHGGTVHAENRNGGGSVFIIRLPAPGPA